VNQVLESSRSDVEFVLRALRRRRGLIAVVAVLTTAAALGFSLLATKMYTGTAVLLFTPPQAAATTLNSSSASSPNEISDRDAATNQGLVGLYETARNTAAALKPPYRVSANFVNGSVSVSGMGTSNLVSVAATTSKPALSAAIANTYAQQFIVNQVQDDRTAYQQALAEVNTQLAHPRRLSALELQTLQSQAQQLRLLTVLQTGDANIAQPALVPSSPSSPDLKRNTAVGLIVGLVLGLALALLLERLDRRIKDLDELETVLDVPMLGAVPESAAFGVSVGNALPGPEAEAFRMLRARLRYFNVDRNIGSLLIASGQPGDGKSTVAYHLARAAATTADTKVLLVEADLRRPHLAERLGVRRAPGLSELLSQPIELDAVVRRLPSPETGPHQEVELDILVAGALPPNPAELLESHKMHDVIAAIKSRYDLVIFDTPPTGVVSDALPLLHQVDGVLLIARINGSTRAGLTRLFDQLKSLKAPVLGMVANHFVPERLGYGYGYGYDYDPEPSSTNGAAAVADSVNGEAGSTSVEPGDEPLFLTGADESAAPDQQGWRGFDESAETPALRDD
jgi:polysaccharide biosynthesis transport protein